MSEQDLMEASGAGSAGSDSGEKKSNNKVKKDEMLAKLQKEREVLEKMEDQCPLALKLVLDEISRVNSGRQDPVKPVDLNRDIPINLHARVKIPYKEFPKFNFVGRLLGPRGTSLQRLQQETITKMTVGGKGCMKDKAKEEELRQSKDPKFAHLHDELHLDVHAYAAPAEAYARMAYALAELRKFLIPVSDKTDDISQAQLRQMELINSGAAPMRGPYGANGGSRPGMGPASYPGMQNGIGPRCLGNRPPPPPIVQQQTSSDVTRQKVLSILDRARKNTMEFTGGAGAMGGSYHPSYGMNDGYYGHGGPDYSSGYSVQHGHSMVPNMNVSDRRRAPPMWL